MRLHRFLPLALSLPMALTLGAAPAAAQTFVPAPQVWTQAHFPGEAVESFDDFGSALATGDFDGDGFDDLAIGAPGETFSGASGAGAVGVLYGGTGGLQAAGGQTLRALWFGQPSGAAFHHFGAALAAGDFDGDGFADLAVGQPDGPGFGGADAGEAVVFFGSPGGLSTSRTANLYLGGSGIFDTPGTSDHFATALAAADVDGDGDAELAVGAPGSDWADGSGAVYLLSGGPEGLSREAQILHIGLFDGAEPSTNDDFGAALATGDFDGDGFADLGIGAPGAWVGTSSLAGEVWVLRGWSGGLFHVQPVRLAQSSTPKLSVAESFDRFGATLAAGDVDGDGRDELAVAAPGESLAAAGSAGSVSVYYGSPAGIGLARAQTFHQGTTGVAGDPAELDRFGAALVLGDTTGDGRADLVAGIPYEGTTGATQRFFGGLYSLSLSNSQLRLQPGTGAPEAHDHFGQALALGDFDGNGVLDLAVGAPGEDLGTATDAGQVHVTYHERPLVIGP